MSGASARPPHPGERHTPALAPVAGHPVWGTTVLEFAGGHLVIDLQRPVTGPAASALPALGLTGPFAIITPCNPSGTVLPDPANARRLTTAREQLDRLGLDGVPVTGRSADGMHREPGWALPVPLAQALDLARQWDQLGFYWWDGDRFQIASTAEIPEP